MPSVLNTEFVKNTSQPIFFGAGLSLQRYDEVKYKCFLDLFKEQLGFFWRPERFDLTKDRPDFENLSEPERFIFVKNLQYQTLLDSVISRGVKVLTEHVSLNEVEAAFKYWEMCEVLHSYSYSYIIQNVFPNPAVVFDDVLRDPEIMARASSVKMAYDSLQAGSGDVRKDLLMALVSTQILEGVRFYVSFACGFSFAEPPSARMEGNAKILKEICRDENLHVDITRNLLNIARTEPSEGFTTLFKRCEEEIIHAFITAADEEKDWASYLFSKGSIFGLNDKVMHGHIDWLTDRRLVGIGLKPIYKCENPIGGWMSKWLNSADLQPAPQETEIESYRTGAVKSNMRTVDFSAAMKRVQQAV